MESISEKIGKEQSGFTLIEVMIAIMVLSFGLLGAALMQMHSTNTNADASNMTEATTLALDQIEQILSWDSGNANLADNNNVFFNRVGINGAVGPGNNQIGIVNNTVADFQNVIEDYTVYYNGTDVNDPVTGNRVGINFEVYVVWTERNDLKTVEMEIVKLL